MSIALRLIAAAAVAVVAVSCGGDSKPEAAPRDLTSVTSRVVLLGDTDFGESYQEAYAAMGYGNVLAERGYDWPLQRMKAVLERADLVVANLETPLTDLRQSPLDGKKSPIHWSDPEAAPRYLRAYNAGAASLANNHAMDYGAEGLEQTLAALDASGIAWFGAGRDAAEAARPYTGSVGEGEAAFRFAVIGAFEYRRTYDREFAFYATRGAAGTNLLLPDAIAAQVKRLKQDDPGVYVIVFPHWGANYEWANREQIFYAHGIIDAGADLIVGHGAHRLQEIERYRGAWIVYSLGNFMFNSRSQYEREARSVPFSLVAEIVIGTAEEGPAKALRLYPIFTDNLVTQYQSRFVTDEEFADLRTLLLRKSASAELAAGMRSGRDEVGVYFELPLD